MPAQPDPAIRNASCAAIIGELAHYMDYWMREVRGSALETDPVTGEQRLLVCYEFYSHAEGPANVL